MRALWEGRCECDPGMWSPVGRGASGAWHLKIKKIDSCRRSFPHCIRFLMLSSTFFMVGLMGSLSFVLHHRGALPMDTSHAQQPFPPHRPAWLEPLQPHTMSDEDLFAQVLHLPTVDRLQERHQEKIAFLFLTRGPLPLAPLWARYFEGHQGRYSVYIHKSAVRYSYSYGELPPSFQERVIPSQPVLWGDASMVAAERRLVGNALMDPGNHHFVLLSESCIPLYNFTFTHTYITSSDSSFVAVSRDERENITYNDILLPEVRRDQWMKGDEWKGLQRRTALQVIGDRLYFQKFAAHCVPPMCDPFVHGYMDERFIPSLLYIQDPGALANRSLTFSDWVRHDHWAHPHTFKVGEVSVAVLEGIRNMTWHVPFGLRTEQAFECRMNGGEVVPCYLFARKFPREALSALLSVLREFGV